MGGVNPVNPKKLLSSKWTAMEPQRKELHFSVVKVDYDEDGKVIECILQAIMTRNEYAIDWRELKQGSRWKQGWK